MKAQEKVMEELVRGRDFENQLRRLLDQSIGDVGLVVKEDLVGKIMDSFRSSISILKSCEYDEVSHLARDGPKSEDSRESISMTSVRKVRRGCYKRRKCLLDSWTREHSINFDDGHAWRKYGQKTIHHDKYPRCYYRCTHKFDQGCQATKQIQMVHENPAKFRSTYYGHHTCTSLLRHAQAQLLLESDSISIGSCSSKMLSFGSPSTFQLHGSSLFSSAQQELSNVPGNGTEDLDQHQPSSPDYPLPSDLMAVRSLDVANYSFDFGDLLDFDFSEALCTCWC